MYSPFSEFVMNLFQPLTNNHAWHQFLWMPYWAHFMVACALIYVGVAAVIVIGNKGK